MIIGVPVLAVEILSPNDKHEDVHDKIVEYLRTGGEVNGQADTWAIDNPN